MHSLWPTGLMSTAQVLLMLILVSSQYGQALNSLRPLTLVPDVVVQIDTLSWVGTLVLLEEKLGSPRVFASFPLVLLPRAVLALLFLFERVLLSLYISPPSLPHPHRFLLS